jgi:uncharacterized protein (TIGR02145 family)
MKLIYTLFFATSCLSILGQNHPICIDSTTSTGIKDRIQTDSTFKKDIIKSDSKTLNNFSEKSTNTPQRQSNLWPAGSVFCASGPTEIVDVFNPKTGKTWMDRNLGATKAATSSADTNSFGDLYQFGRGNDGHQCRRSPVTSTLSSVDQPNHGEFINAQNNPHDWRIPQKSKLWKGVKATNNPCPIGYRLPTNKEMLAERLSWVSQDAAGALASTLKLPLPGFRSVSGSLNSLGTGGVYWTSTTARKKAQRMAIDSSASGYGEIFRAAGLSVRCIKN